MPGKGTSGMRACLVSPKKKPRILVYGYYGCGNLGDDLILASIHQWLTVRGGFREILVKCRSKDGLPRHRVEACLKMDRILEDPRHSPWVKVWRLLREFDRILRSVQFLFLGGGTLFHAKNGDPRNLMVLALLVRVARWRGVSVYCLGVGVDRLKGCLPRLLFRDIVRNTKDFAVRDQGSQKHAREVAPKSRFRLTSDLVHRLSLGGGCVRKGPVRRHLGITLASSALAVDRRAVGSEQENLGKVLNLLHEEGWRISFLSFQESNSAHPDLSDQTWFACFCSRQLSFRPEILGPPPGLRQAVAQIRKFGILLGMRYHSLLIAARCGVPFVGIGQDPKIKSICSTYHRPFQPWEGLENRELLAILCQPTRYFSAKSINRQEAARAEANFFQLSQALS